MHSTLAISRLRPRWGRLLGAACVICGAASAPRAAAQSGPLPGASDQARQHFERGTSLYRAADYALALTEFERAHALSGNFLVLFNIGQVNLELRRYAAARRALELYLQSDSGQLTSERRSAVKADLAFLRDRTGSLHVHVSPAGAPVLLDGLPFSTQRATWVDVGTHAVVVERGGLVVQRIFVDVAAGEDAHVHVDAAPRAGTNPATKPEPGRAAPRSKLAFTNPKVWPLPVVGWSTTGAFTITAVLSHVVAASQRDTLEELRLQRSTTADREAQARDARGWSIAADVFTAASVVAAGVSLFVTLRPVNHPPAAGARTTFRGSDLVVRF